MICIHIMYNHIGSSYLISYIATDHYVLLFRYPTRTSRNNCDQITPTLAKARKLLQDQNLKKQVRQIAIESERNVRFDVSSSNEFEQNVDSSKDDGKSESTGEDTCRQQNISNPDENVGEEEQCFGDSYRSHTMGDGFENVKKTENCPSESELKMENFKRNLILKKVAETREMAPYMVLMDENKKLPPREYPDPKTMWNEERFMFLNHQHRSDRLPLIRNRETGLGSKLSRFIGEYPLQSRSDSFFQQTEQKDKGQLKSKSAVNWSGTPASSTVSNKYRSKSVQGDYLPNQRNSQRSALSTSYSDSVSGLTRSKTMMGFRRKPLTHAMVREERQQVNKKLNSYLEKVEKELGISLYTKRKVSSAGSSSVGSEPTLAKLSSGPAMHDSQSQLVTTTSPRDKYVPAPKRGIPYNTEQRSKRHSPTFKLQQVVKKLMQRKSMMELMELDKLRDLGKEVAQEQGDVVNNSESEVIQKVTGY